MTEPPTAPSSSSSSAPPSKTSAPPASRLGFVLFVLYATLYLGFVLLNAFAANRMDSIVFSGLNLAIVYGFGLILVAIGFSLVYGLALHNQHEANGDEE